MMIGSLLLAALLSAGNGEFEDSARVLAATMRAAEIRKNLGAVASAECDLAKAMLSSPERFVSRAEAVVAAKAVYEDWLSKRYAAEIADLIAKLQLAEGVVTNQLDEATRLAAMKGFDRAFAEARKHAVATQAVKLAAKTRPSEAAFEQLDEATFKAEMIRRVASESGETVFEENLDFIRTTMVEPVMESARRERRRQQEYLMRSRSEAYAPSALQADIADKLVANVKEHQAKATNVLMAWSVFPSVTNVALKAAAERRALERWRKQAEGTMIEPTRAEIAEAMAADPAKHVKRADSEGVFAAGYAKRLAQAAAQAAMAEAPAAERAEFSEFLLQHSDDAEVMKLVEGRVRREVMPKWRVLREQLALSLATDTWPQLLDRTWFPNPELADSVISRSDCVEAIKNWRATAGMETLAAAANARTLPEESLVVADVGVAKAFERARGAVNAQLLAVDANREELLIKVRERNSSFFGRNFDLAEIIKMLTASTLEAWGACREQVLWPNGEAKPVNADEQYVGLFPSVERKIELVARSILEESASKIKVEAPSAEEASSSSAKAAAATEKSTTAEPPSPPPENSDNSESSEETESSTQSQIEFSVVIGRENGRVQVKLLRNGEMVVDRDEPAKLNDFKAAMKAVTEKLGREIMQLK